MEIASLIIAILALVGSLYTYFNHDKLIKKQLKSINEYQLEQFKAEQEEKKKAIIEATYINRYNLEALTLKVCNKGKSVAKNVNVVIPFPEMDCGINPFPVDILPEHSFDLCINPTAAPILVKK